MRTTAIGDSCFWKLSLAALAFICTLVVPAAAIAANDGELWEVTMDVPGMPPGMMPPQQSCQSKDWRNYKPSRDSQDCKVTNIKESARQVVVTMSCPQGPASAEYNFNAGRTEYKAVMKMTDRGREMSMNMAGRKIGVCDVQVATQQREQKQAQMKAEGERIQAQSAAMMKRADEEQVRMCAAAAENMTVEGLGMYGRCYNKNNADKNCDKSMRDTPRTQPEASKACPARAAEICSRYQTPEGFDKAVKSKRSDAIDNMCGLSPDRVKVSVCSQALKKDSADFLGLYCPAEAKQYCSKALKLENYNFVARYCPAETEQVAKVHCVGRDYTALTEDKRYGRICRAYLKDKDFKDSESDGGKSDKKKSAREDARDKLKGLFGR